MSEATQIHIDLEVEGEEVETGFQGALNYIRRIAPTESHKGRLFERLMQRYLRVDPIYKDLFTEVWLWKEWTALRTDFDGVDIGIDLVARDRDGGYYAIQCKCYGENTRITKPQIDSFISASASDVFTKLMLIHTAGGLNANVRRTIDPLGDKFHVIGYGHLASRPINWPRPPL